MADDGVHGRELWKLDPATGVNSLLWSSGLFALAPNPANTSVQVTLFPPGPGDRYSLRLFDTAGDVVYAAENVASGTLSIPLGHLPAGVYSLVVVSQQRVQSGRVVVGY